MMVNHNRPARANQRKNRIDFWCGKNAVKKPYASERAGVTTVGRKYKRGQSKDLTSLLEKPEG